KEVIADAECYGPYRTSALIVEIMGRHAGWLTAAAALGGNKPDLIYLPEVSFDPKDFVKRVKEITKKKSSVVIAVSEGIKLANGEFVSAQGADAKKDAFGHTQLSGVGDYLANILTAEAGIKARAIEFSTMQRCATHVVSRTDSDEAYNAGYMAAQKALEGCTGEMVVIKVESRAPYVTSYSTFDIHEVANVERTVPLEWITNDGTYVSDEFIEYAQPLIEGEIDAYYSKGVPQHLTLSE
ncbi:MAG: 6-phosphofructokinase, partial [Mogibacterium sp.]|nr:6-phosphofructokinase [Mogibacterium sp.]